MGRSCLAFQSVIRCAVHHVDVEPAIVVVVKECNPGAVGFQNEALFGSASRVMPGGEARLLSGVQEDDRSSFGEATGRNRTMFSVEFRWMNCAGGHAGMRRCFLRHRRTRAA
jgi:hypothetical protein